MECIWSCLPSQTCERSLGWYQPNFSLVTLIRDSRWFDNDIQKRKIDQSSQTTARALRISSSCMVSLGRSTYISIILHRSFLQLPVYLCLSFIYAYATFCHSGYVTLPTGSILHIAILLRSTTSTNTLKRIISKVTLGARSMPKGVGGGPHWDAWQTRWSFRGELIWAASDSFEQLSTTSERLAIATVQQSGLR